MSTLSHIGPCFKFDLCGQALTWDARCCRDEDTAQRAAPSSCLVQPVLLTVAVELPPEIPYCPPNAMDVADPHAHFIYVWYRQYQLETYETEWKSFKCCQTYVVQLEKSISQRCDTKCCHTNVAADPTIIECDEDVMLWGKIFDCNWVIIGLDLGVGDLFWKFIFSLNRAWKWFNSKFNSKQNPKYSFKKIFIQNKIQNIHSKKYSFNRVQNIQ